MASLIRSVIAKELLRTATGKNLSKTIRSASSTCRVLLNNRDLKIKTNQMVLNASANCLVGKRFYAEQAQLTNEQIEEKVLNIFINFDRIKENPANLKVCSSCVA
jgi:hypothetical protein